MNRADPAMGSRQRIARGLRVALAMIACSIILTPFLLDLSNGSEIHFGSEERVAITIGVAYLILSAVLHRLPFVVYRVSLVLIAVPVLVGSVECAGRLSGYDFARIRTRWLEMPIYYRQPTEPIGEVYFRRPGPAKWTGKVLTTRLRLANVKEWDAYTDEKEIVVSYDEEGFRNPTRLVDWDIVILGDSFTELGHLPYSDLFSSQLADMLNCRVKNLGVSYTGTLSQCCFLREYGITGSTTDAILVFYEGNDVKDTLREFRSLQQYRQSGNRELRELSEHKQTSFIRAVSSIWQGDQNPKAKRSVVNATFVSGETRVGLTVSNAPPNQADLSSEEITAVESALKEFADIGRNQNIRAWLIYMPCKRRALHNHLEFLSEQPESISSWTPSDLPGWIEEVCERNRIRFLDLTPHFVESADSGNLLFNHVFDSHLNRDGSALVANVLTESIRRRSSEHTK